MAAAATEMLCRLIIFPMTPPLEFDAAMSSGDNPSVFAGNDLKVAEQRIRRRIAAGQEHAAATRAKRAKNGNIAPVAAKARPSVAVFPQ